MHPAICVAALIFIPGAVCTKWIGIMCNTLHSRQYRVASTGECLLHDRMSGLAESMGGFSMSRCEMQVSIE